MLNPGLVICIFFSAGIISGQLFGMPPAYIAAALTFVLLLCRKTTFIYFMLFFIAGQGLFFFADKQGRDSIRQFQALELTQISVSGHVAEPMRVFGNKRSALIKIDGFEGRRIRSLTLLEVQTLKPVSFKTGDYIRLKGKFLPIKQNDQFSISKHIRGKVFVTGNVVIQKAKNPIYRFSQIINGQVEAIADLYLPKEHKGLFWGMLLGDVSLMTQDQSEMFRRSGLTHLVAVSGSNLAMLIVPILIALTWAGAAKHYRFPVIIATVVFYAFATGLQAPILRASVMTVTALAGIFFIGHKKTLSLLSFACITLLAWDPFLIKNPGFLFSFASTLGLVVFMPTLKNNFKFLPEAISIPLATALAAQILVIPISGYYFGEISTASLLANLLAAPLVPLITNSGLVAIAAYNIFRPSTFLPVFLSNAMIGLLIKIAGFFGGFSWAMTDVYFSPVLCLSYLGIVWFIFIDKKAQPVTKLKFTVALLLGIAVYFTWTPVINPPGPKHALEVTFIDVGQADSALVRAKSGVNIVIDTGKSDNRALTALKQKGVKKIDVLIISHFEEDHCGGTKVILEKFDVKTLVVPEVGVESTARQQILEQAAKLKIRVIEATKGDDWSIGDASIEVLHPERGKPMLSANSNSLVTKVTYRANSFLFTGDLEKDGQDQLETVTDIKSDVIKIPHHGAADAADEEFLDTADPSMAVISAGKNNPYGHPSQKYLSLLSRKGISVRRTDLNGNIELASDGNNVFLIEGGNN